jgi:hypothetical protein
MVAYLKCQPICYIRRAEFEGKEATANPVFFQVALGRTR